ncbi:metal-dependent hydrolase [Nocardia cyriacigeorgica]|uniref:metal-dependent hydrolase n=1 Tax=Nocardia cyriacigeorgica TaxID=135487 RepID=UPI0024586323|nr:metal-dependent hydrolase [Nocardia cyriacigeorgica]
MRFRRKSGPVRVDPGAVSLQARNVQFDWTDTPLHWIPDEPIASHVMNSLNLLLPEGERMFCQTFSEALPMVRDEKVREDMIGFIGQESMHAETHNKVLDQVLSGQGIDVEPYVRQAEFLFRTAAGPRPARSERARRQHLVERLAIIACLEHFFAFLGDWVLNADLEGKNADPRMADLYRWHGAEEVEHRNVAHDVAVYFGAGYLRRAIPMLLVFPLFIVLVARGTKFLVTADPSLPTMGYLRLTIKLFGAMWRGALPGVPSLLWSALSTFNPRYSPESVGSTSQAVAYLATSPAAKAIAS